MAQGNSNYANGQRYRKFLQSEDKFVEKIDHRDKTGKSTEDYDTAMQDYTVNNDGERCWSF